MVFIRKIYTQKLMFEVATHFFVWANGFFWGMGACQEFCGLTLSEANVFDGEWVLMFVDLKLPLFPYNL